MLASDCPVGAQECTENVVVGEEIWWSQAAPGLCQQRTEIISSVKQLGFKLCFLADISGVELALDILQILRPASPLSGLVGQVLRDEAGLDHVLLKHFDQYIEDAASQRKGPFMRLVADIRHSH